MSQPTRQAQSKTSGDASSGNNNDSSNPSNAPMASSTNPSSTANPSQTQAPDNSQDMGGNNNNDNVDPLDTSAGNIQPDAIHHGPVPEGDSPVKSVKSRIIDILGLPRGFTLEHDTRTIISQTGIRGYGLQGTQTPYVIHNVPESLEKDLIDYLTIVRISSIGITPFQKAPQTSKMLNDGQQVLTIEFYRLANDALLNLSLTFLCWELHYTGHAHSKQSSPRKWCYKHRVVDEVTCGLGYILLINATVHSPRYRAIQAYTRGHPAYADAQKVWRYLQPSFC